MRILTDCREHASELAPAGTAWIPCEASALDEPERGLWRAFAESPVAWSAALEKGTSSDFWRRLIVIGEATRSQFDALREALGDGLTLDGPTAILAIDGRNFRGQRGRPWSPIEGNLFLTAIRRERFRILCRGRTGGRTGPRPHHVARGGGR